MQGLQCGPGLGDDAGVVVLAAFEDAVEDETACVQRT